MNIALYETAALQLRAFESTLALLIEKASAEEEVTYADFYKAQEAYTAGQISIPKFDRVAKIKMNAILLHKDLKSLSRQITQRAVEVEESAAELRVLDDSQAEAEDEAPRFFQVMYVDGNCLAEKTRKGCTVDGLALAVKAAKKLQEQGKTNVHLAYLHWGVERREIPANHLNDLIAAAITSTAALKAACHRFMDAHE